MSIFEQVREIPIEDVIAKYLPSVDFKHSGRLQVAKCPFPPHEEKQASFTVYTDSNSWICYGCGRGGSIIDLVMEAKGLSAYEAAKELAMAWNIPFQELTPEEKEEHQKIETRQQLLVKYVDWAQKQLGPDQREVLHKRGLTDETIAEYQIGFDPARSDFKPAEEKLENYQALGFIGSGGGYLPGGRVVIPVFRYNKPIFVIFWDYQHTETSVMPKYFYPTGVSKPLVGLDLIRRDKPVYLTEGVFDWLSMRQAGYIVVCTLGTSVKAEHQERLKRASQILVMFDNDSGKEKNPGQKAAGELLKEMYPAAKNIILPDGEDPNSCFQDNPKGFNELIDRLTSQAKDAAEVLFEQLEAMSTEEIKSKGKKGRIEYLLNRLIPLIAKLDNETTKDMLINRIHKSLKPAGITKKSLQNEVKKATGEQGEDVGEEEKETQQDKLIRLAESAFLFKNEFREPFAQIGLDDHQEIWKCSSRDFKFWLTGKYFDETGKGPNSEALGAAINTINAKAWRNKEEFKLHTRVAELDGTKTILDGLDDIETKPSNSEAMRDKALDGLDGLDGINSMQGESVFCYDLTDKQWRAIKITSSGWEIISPPILFRRYGHQQAQPEPIHNGDVFKLLQFVNLKDEKQIILYLVSIITSFIPDIPHVIFVFFGGEGSGKSTASKFTRMIVDPSSSLTCGCYDDRKEFVQYMAHNYVIILENLSGISKKLSDSICAAVTGDGDSKRQLFTDDDDIIYNFKRVFIINGINNVVTRADLLRRSILFEIEKKPDNEILPEKELWQQFNEVRPQIMGSVFDVLAKAIQFYPQIKLTGYYDMADYTIWGCAVAEALGYGADAFLAAYAENLGKQVEEAVANHPVASAVTALLQDKKEWHGTPSELLGELEKIAGDEKINVKSKSWPKAANSLTRRLNEAKTILNKTGIQIDKSKSGNREIMLTPQYRNNTVQTVQSVQSQVAQSLKDGRYVDGIDISEKIPSKGHNEDYVDTPQTLHAGNADSTCLDEVYVGNEGFSGCVPGGVPEEKKERKNADDDDPDKGKDDDLLRGEI